MGSLFSMHNLARVGVGAALIYAIGTGKLHGANGKFLGFIDDQDGFGLDDVAKAAVVVLGSKFGASALMGVLGK